MDYTRSYKERLKRIYFKNNINNKCSSCRYVNSISYNEDLCIICSHSKDLTEEQRELLSGEWEEIPHETICGIYWRLDNIGKFHRLRGALFDFLNNHYK